MSKIVVKVGSNVLTKKDGALDQEVIKGIVNQIATLKKEGHTVVLVSSGAVASGKSIYTLKNTADPTIRRQVYSSIGQVRLLNLYYELFSEHDIICSQVLATRDDFLGGEHYRNMKNCFNALLLDSIIPIVNENDVVSLEELMFTDNDELAGLMAFLIDADRLIILSNINGFYDGDPENSSSSIIHEIAFDDDFSHLVQRAKSNAGRGGMKSKYDTAKKVASKGILTTIANGKTEDIIFKILNKEKVGTTFSL